MMINEWSTKIGISMTPWAVIVLGNNYTGHIGQALIFKREMIMKKKTSSQEQTDQLQSNLTKSTLWQLKAIQVCKNKGPKQTLFKYQWLKNMNTFRNYLLQHHIANCKLITCKELFIGRESLSLFNWRFILGEINSGKKLRTLKSILHKHFFNFVPTFWICFTFIQLV